MNIQLIPLQIHGDDRGALVSLERDKNRFGESETILFYRKIEL